MAGTWRPRVDSAVQGSQKARPSSSVYSRPQGSTSSTPHVRLPSSVYSRKTTGSVYELEDIPLDHLPPVPPVPKLRVFPPVPKVDPPDYFAPSPISTPPKAYVPPSVEEGGEGSNPPAEHHSWPLRTDRNQPSQQSEQQQPSSPGPYTQERQKGFDEALAKLEGTDPESEPGPSSSWARLCAKAAEQQRFENWCREQRERDAAIGQKLTARAPSIEVTSPTTVGSRASGEEGKFVPRLKKTATIQDNTHLVVPPRHQYGQPSGPEARARRDPRTHPGYRNPYDYYPYVCHPDTFKGIVEAVRDVAWSVSGFFGCGTRRRKFEKDWTKSFDRGYAEQWVGGTPDDRSRFEPPDIELVRTPEPAVVRKPRIVEQKAPGAPILPSAATFEQAAPPASEPTEAPADPAAPSPSIKLPNGLPKPDPKQHKPKALSLDKAQAKFLNRADLNPIFVVATAAVNEPQPTRPLKTVRRLSTETCFGDFITAWDEEPTEGEGSLPEMADEAFNGPDSDKPLPALPAEAYTNAGQLQLRKRHERDRPSLFIDTELAASFNDAIPQPPSPDSLHSVFSPNKNDHAARLSKTLREKRQSDMRTRNRSSYFGDTGSDWSGAAEEARIREESLRSLRSEASKRSQGSSGGRTWREV